MFSRSQRISSVLLDEILEKGHSYRSAHFSMAVLKKRLQNKAKIAVVVPRKVASKAVHRNKLRRQVRDWLKKNLASRVNPVAQLVFFANQGWEGHLPASFQEEIKELFSKAGIIV